jgi:hypothetical protein
MQNRYLPLRDKFLCFQIFNERKFLKYIVQLHLIYSKSTVYRLHFSPDACNGGIIVTSPGYIISPKYQDDGNGVYDSNIICLWKIDAGINNVSRIDNIKES